MIFGKFFPDFLSIASEGINDNLSFFVPLLSDIGASSRLLKCLRYRPRQ